MDKLNLAFKMCVFGDSGVGKSTMIKRFITNKFEHDLKSTIGTDILMKFIETESARITLQIWDFAGESRFSSLLPSYAQGSSAAIFMCDITNGDSIKNIDNWLLTFNEGLNNQNPNFPLLVVGGKLDLDNQRSITSQDIEAYLTVRKTFDYFECSSKTGKNIEALFQFLINRMLEYANIQLITR